MRPIDEGQISNVGSEKILALVVRRRPCQLPHVLLAIVLAQSTAQPLNWSVDDGARVDQLKKTGVRTEGVHVVLWTPADGLTEEQRRDLVKKLDLGLPAVKRLIGRHSWQVVRDQKMTYG
jgi:hypothetical protein